MIHSVLHPQTSAWHRHHTRRYRSTLVIMAGIIGSVLFLNYVGTFGVVSWASLSEAVARTTFRLAVAYTLALMLGTGLALVVGWSRYSDLLFPVFDILQNVPSFALIPLFIYFFGFSDQMIILFAVSSITWPILFSVLTAIKSAHTDLNEAATIFGAVGLRRIIYYLAPLSFPAILSGSIVGIAIGWEAVIGAEIIADTSGFGTFIKTASSYGIDESTIAGMFAILIIVFIINRLVWSPLLQESKHYAE